MNEITTISNNKELTTSVVVANAFNRTHRDVTKAIKELNCSSEFRLHHFMSSSYVSLQNKRLECVSMTRNGFILLTMGFTGAKSALFKEIILDRLSKRTLESVIEMISNMDIDINEDIYIYVAREGDSGNFKIGISKNPARRVKELNVGNPNKLVLVHAYQARDDKFKSESKAHSLFENKRLTSEWFSGDIELSKLPSYK